MPAEIARLTQNSSDPVRIDITPPGMAASGITHRLYLVDVDNKRPAILALVNQELGPTLIFVRRRSDAEWLFRIFQRAGHPVERIHSDLSQKERLDALSGFREGPTASRSSPTSRCAVSTSVIRHVINFDLPENVEDTSIAPAAPRAVTPPDWCRRSPAGWKRKRSATSRRLGEPPPLRGAGGRTVRRAGAAQPTRRRRRSARR
jgi:hypothetical protein